MIEVRASVFDQNAFSLGIGVTVGDYSWREIWFDSGGSIKSWSPAWRANVEASYEFRSLGGFSVRPYLGAAILIDRGAGVCYEPGLADLHCETVHRDDPSRPAVYSGISIGYTFL